MRVSSLIAGKKVATISPSASFHDLVVALTTNAVGALVVSTDGRIIEGIVSERDIVRALPDRLESLTAIKVSDLMTSEVVTCTVDTSVAELMSTMTDMRIRHVPVADAEGKLISIVSIGDVVKAHIDVLDTERQALNEYIHS
jgi:CBS domain-containing protein